MISVLKWAAIAFLYMLLVMGVLGLIIGKFEKSLLQAGLLGYMVLLSLVVNTHLDEICDFIDNVLDSIRKTWKRP